LTKPDIALTQITAAVEQGVPVGEVLADAACSDDSKFRNGLEALGLQYVLGIQRTTAVWPEDSVPLQPYPYQGRGQCVNWPRDLYHSLSHGELA